MAKKAPRKPLTVHYRRLVDVTTSLNGLSLQNALSRSMEINVGGNPLKDHWRQRAWVMPPQEEDTFLLNLHKIDNKYFFGDLTLYSRGYLQLLMQSNINDPVLNITQSPPPDGMEYVHSIMYWMVVDNHVMIIQSNSLSARDLERYLTWLLRDRASIMDKTGQVQLQSKFDLSEVGGQLDDIREIVVGGMSMETNISPATTGEREVTEYRDLGTKSTGMKRGIEVLRALFTNEADVNKLLDSIPEEAQLEVSVHIGYKSKKRKISRKPMQQALRNLPEGEIRAIGRDGKMSGSDIRLSHQVSVLCEGRMLNPEDVVRALYGAYTYFIDNGKIVP